MDDKLTDFGDISVIVDNREFDVKSAIVGAQIFIPKKSTLVNSLPGMKVVKVIVRKPGREMILTHHFFRIQMLWILLLSSENWIL